MLNFIGRSSLTLIMLVILTISAEASGLVTVNNVEELYAAVNDPANVGVTVRLRPGVYLLSPLDPNGLPRLNRGRIELQENMSLRGSLGNREAAVIDAIGLPVASYQGSGQPLTAAIRVGRGRNAIEWLTVRNAQVGGANIDTSLNFPGVADVKIAHIASTGAIRGLNAINFGPANSGETLEIDIINNKFFDNTFGLSEGLRIGNFQGAVGSTVNARMIGNQSWGNQQGRLIVNNRAIDSTINVYSAGNRFFDNGAGTIIVGGLSSNATVANGNSINFTGFGDRFSDNTAFGQFDKGGLVVVGGENISIPNGTNNNTVNVELWFCELSGNQVWDLGAIGARSAPESIGSPGVSNNVTVKLHFVWPRSFVEFVADSLPADPATTNTATVIH